MLKEDLFVGKVAQTVAQVHKAGETEIPCAIFRCASVKFQVFKGCQQVLRPWSRRDLL